MYLLFLLWGGFIAGAVMFEGHRMLCKSSQPKLYLVHYLQLNDSGANRGNRVTHFLMTDRSGSH